MTSIEQKSVCNFCNKEFEWTAILKTKNGEVFTAPQVVAQAFATGKVNLTNGKLINFDVIAKCPNCLIENKFTVSEKCEKFHLL